MGRPETAPNRRQVGLDDDLWKRVTAYRFAQFLESESAALRELVVMGLEVAERKPTPAKKPATARGSRTKPRR
jgi:murein endopeptidase